MLFALFIIGLSLVAVGLITRAYVLVVLTVFLLLCCLAVTAGMVWILRSRGYLMKRPSWSWLKWLLKQAQQYLRDIRTVLRWPFGNLVNISWSWLKWLLKQAQQYLEDIRIVFFLGTPSSVPGDATEAQRQRDQRMVAIIMKTIVVTGIMAGLVFLFSISFLVISRSALAIMGSLVLALISFVVCSWCATYLLRGVRRVDENRVWLIEVWGRYYAEWTSGTHILLQGIMNPVADFPAKTQDMFFPIFSKDNDDVAFKDGRMNVKVQVAVRVASPYQVQYGMTGVDREGDVLYGQEASLAFLKGYLQDMFQTMMSTRTILEAFFLAGVDLVEDLWEKPPIPSALTGPVEEGKIKKKYQKLVLAIRSLGFTISQIVIADYEAPPELQAAQSKMAVALYESVADAATRTRAIWVMAGLQAGILTSFDEWTDAERKKAKPFLSKFVNVRLKLDILAEIGKGNLRVLPEVLLRDFLGHDIFAGISKP